jgi:acyl carrier protein
LSLERGPTDKAPVTADEVLGALRTILADVIGEEYIAEIAIELETSFYKDLELESIEFVALGGKLQERYGDRIDFPAWIATMEVDEIIAMRVDDVVRYIVTSLS